MQSLKKIVCLVPLLVLHLAITAQELRQVSFSQGTSFAYFTFITDREVHIRVSEHGTIEAFGVEQPSIRNSNYYAPQLQPYVGPVEYYNAQSDAAYQGKIRRIGSSNISYYGSYEIASRRGKIKSIGYVMIDYYDGTDPLLDGKIKSIGNNSIQFYASFDNESVRGKLKAVGRTSISYYSNFDDKVYRGKVKAVGTNRYTYYSSVDRREYQGALKSGAQRMEEAGIIYVLW